MDDHHLIILNDVNESTLSSTFVMIVQEHHIVPVFANLLGI